jgi:hypothetical protein
METSEVSKDLKERVVDLSELFMIRISLEERVRSLGVSACGAVGTDSGAGGVIHADVVVRAAEKVVSTLTGLRAGFHAAFSTGRGGGRAGSTGRDGVNRLLRSTDSSSVVNDLDLHVSLVTPGSSPRVSHDPVLNAVSGSVSDHTDSVIKVGSARRGVHDTSLVDLEDTLISLNEDRYRLFVESGLDSGSGVGSDHLVGGGLNASSCTVVSTGTILSYVRVAGLRHGEVLLVVRERGGLHTSIASIVRLGAIDKLLLSEREEGSRFDEVSSFHGHVGGERPTRSTLSLVLDCVNGTLVSPVNTIGGSRSRTVTTLVAR